MVNDFDMSMVFPLPYIPSLQDFPYKASCSLSVVSAAEGLFSFLEFLNSLPAAALRPLLPGRGEGTRRAESTLGQCFTARMCQHEDQGVLQIKHHLAVFLSASYLFFSIFCLRLFDVKINNPPSSHTTSFPN